MPLPAMSSAESQLRAPARRAATAWWRTLGRHQIGAAVATAVDFGLMILLVERIGLSPVAATAISAPIGGLTNFVLGRAWIFRLHSGHWAAQAARYALVSGASVGWNTAGEHLLHDGAHVEYVGARIVVSILVSLLWNFPVQRRWVFREGRAERLR
jgi:putative flippase GtrA